jgi:HPt (histidine-containing phosphotransfer) domain-containing protein
MSIDPSALAPYRNVMGADADAFVADLIESYLANSGDLVAAIETALTTHNSDSFIRSAHTLKSNSAIFGANVLSGFCQELETAGQEGNLAALKPKVDQMKAEYKQVCQELTDLRHTLPI